MRKTAKLVATAASVITLLGSLSLAPVDTAVAASKVKEGKKIAWNRKKGNCLACHAMKGGKLAGNIGPPLIGMKRMTKKQLKEKIWDPEKTNPNTSMPPFGKHKILSEKEIDLIVEYVHTL
jgi:sulfur-oxidizing protein SoxX